MEALISEQKGLDEFYKAAMAKGFSFVTWRSPQKKMPTTLLQWKTQPEIIKNIQDVEEKKGFIFAPFDNHERHPIRFIKPEKIIHGTKDLDFVKDIDLSNYPEVRKIDKITNHRDISDPEHFSKNVRTIKKIIRESSLDKLVLSQLSRTRVGENFSPTGFFNALNESYPHAFVYMLYIHESGLWFGATPEPLLIIEDGTASTVSLAGTRPYKKGETQKPWEDKEMDEQEIVTSYIEKVLQNNEIDDYIKKGPFTYKAANIEHLKSTFSFPSSKLDGKLSKFINDLHPTPSVCGLPKDIAMEWISKLEKHEREYYTGYLGPVNLEKEWKLFVNLRCMKLVDGFHNYYVGAGITAGSSPRKEWEETLSKKKTLESIIESLNTP
ncbi:MAG: chorismate-binding protein [Bacteroidales bacterium]